MDPSEPTRPMPAGGPKAGTPRPKRRSRGGIPAAPPPSDPSPGADGLADEPAQPKRPKRPKRHGRFHSLLVFLSVIAVTIGLAVGGVYAWLQGSVGPVTIRELCTGQFSDGSSHSLELDQANNAAIITAIAEKRDFPIRAATIAVATAIQESKLRNLTYGDRDSVGLFQQRPSQGWGDRDEILDPVYATNAFYDALVKIDDLNDLTITEAAQEVQRSAYPEAYADHEPEARMIVSPLAGYSPGGWNCVLREDDDLSAQQPGDDGLTDRAAAVTDAAKTELGRKKWTSDSTGTAVTFTVAAADDNRTSWAMASWAVARAEELGVKQVTMAGHQWVRSSSSDGWVATDTGLGDRQVRITVY